MISKLKILIIFGFGFIYTIYILTTIQASENILWVETCKKRFSA
ncbi:hypothetical protein HMPREF9554_01879 [Treponema phagedenis F0421]|nr:hypothetical protein HMPREF9554_01879 [Treponema phagedenis F0421]